MPIKPMNPYATPRPGEDIANGFISFSLKTLREHDASVFEAGRQAEREERERESYLARVGLSESGQYEHDREIEREAGL